MWNDESASVRNIIPASEDDMSMATKELKEYLDLKSANLVAVESLEQTLSTRRDALLEMKGEHGLSEPDLVDISTAKEVLANFRCDILDSLSQAEIQKRLIEFTSRQDQAWRGVCKVKDFRSKKSLQEKIADDLASGLAENSKIANIQNGIRTDMKHFRSENRLDRQGTFAKHSFGWVRHWTYGLFAYRRSVWRLQGPWKLSYSHSLLNDFWKARVLIEEEYLLTAGWIFQHSGIWRAADLQLEVGYRPLYIPELPSWYTESLTMKGKQRAEKAVDTGSGFGNTGAQNQE